MFYHIARERKIFPTKVIEKIKLQILIAITFLYAAVYERMWRNNVQPDRPQTIIWRMNIVDG
jgi:hypothetical protein